MVPADFETYFATMAAVGGTLFGLIFVAVSISPENTVQKDAPIGRQVRAAGSYNALLNPLVISLFALIPHEDISYPTLVMSILGLVSMLFMAFSLLPQSSGWYARFHDGLFILGGLVLYGFETYYGLRLLQSESDSYALYSLATLFIIIDTFGLARAWSLLGVRQFPIQDRHPHQDKNSA